MERQFVESMVWVHCQEIGLEEERRRTEVGELSCYSRTHSQGPFGRASQLMYHHIILLLCVFVCECRFMCRLTHIQALTLAYRESAQKSSQVYLYSPKSQITFLPQRDLQSAQDTTLAILYTHTHTRIKELYRENKRRNFRKSSRDRCNIHRVDKK